MATVFLVSRRLRRALRLDVALRKLPLRATLQEVDAALREHRLQPGSTILIFLFSLAGQLFGFLDAWCMARALGVDLSLVQVLVVLPVIQVFCIIPISPGAWGVGEGLYVYFFGLVGIGASGAAGISIGSRLIYTVQSLLGGLFLLHAPEDVRRAREEVRRQACEDTGSSAATDGPPVEPR
jgi:uncharacterized protein (TIRG00374 family)